MLTSEQKQFIEIIYCTSVNDYDTFSRMIAETDGSASSLMYICSHYSFDEACWSEISQRKLSVAFIRKFKHFLNWTFVSRNHYLTEKTMREFSNKLDYGDIAIHQHLSEQFIIDFFEELNMDLVSLHQSLSDEFIKKYHFHLNFDMLSLNKNLSICILKSFYYKVNWNDVSYYNKISRKMIRELKDHLILDFILINKNVSQKTKEYAKKIIGKYKFEQQSKEQNYERSILLLPEK